MENKIQIDLYEFLVESELQHYYNALKNELKITNVSQFKYAADEDLKQIGMSRPEIRRLRKFYEKYFPHGYISKIKRFLQTNAPNVKREAYSSMHAQIPSEHDKSLMDPPKSVPNNKHIIPADAICVNKQLGVGEFGIVQQGVWTNGTERIQVAIKCLCRERMQSNPMEFLKEASIMHSIEHENIVRLYGVVLAADSLMLVTELAHLRSLLECLKDSGLRVSFLTAPALCEFAMQICNGMMYLENKRLIHRDLAARNILVFNKNKVKISDFGLSRALGVGKDYYKTNFNVNLKLPIAWCAPECINFLRFTNASDVWAFGVCLWEMFSYGFQPWAALTGLQILAAIDEPNYQRLEQPECCPREYYALMLKCWNHDPAKRPKFSEIYAQLPDIKPEQLKAVVNNCEPKKDHLMYRIGDIITVLDKNTNSSLWKGVLNSGKTGLFNPTNTVAYMEGLSSANRDSFSRTNERFSKRKLRTEMISKPQDDFKHTGHIGIDGESFGDIAFLSNPQNSQNNSRLPRQIVTPYKPSEDIEQTPLLLPPTPTSPDSLQTASGYFAEDNPAATFSNAQNGSTFDTFKFPSKALKSLNPFSLDPPPSGRNGTHTYGGLERNAFTNENLEYDERTVHTLTTNGLQPQDDQHEYHEISDDDITTDAAFDLGPSLLDEINSVFGSISTTSDACTSKSFEYEQTNRKNDIAELVNNHKSKKKSSTGIVKQISVKDEKILNQAIEIANKISAQSMTDLVSSEHAGAATQSPRRKFSFRFPTMSHHGSNDKDTPANGDCNGGLGAAGLHSKERKNFSEELKSIPDLQHSITEEGRLAYNSLIERKAIEYDSNGFYLTNANTLPRQSVNFNADKLDSVSVPIQKPNRHVMTLPNRSCTGKKFVLLKPLRNIKNTENDCNEVCESPSYLMSPSYNFPEKPVTKVEPESPNAIPLPPRDRNKVIASNPKRHVRKHPLIVPASLVPGILSSDKQNNVHQSPAKERHSPMKNGNLDNDSRIYANVSDIDTASVQFESILEDESNKTDVLSSPDVIDGFYPFAIQKEIYKKGKETAAFDSTKISDDELRNLDIERNRIQFQQNNVNLTSCPAVPTSADESEHDKLAAETALQNLNSVSCEDLLEFSNKKPKGFERGTDSDEVRIMIKVLGKDCSPQRCLNVLEFIDWDVHRAIKLIKLQNILGAKNLTLTECADGLTMYDWDLQMTSLKMK